MNYDNKGTLYEEAKKSLKKFKGGDSISSASVKLEPAYFTDNEETLLAAGYVRGKRGKQGGGDREENWQRWRPRRGGPGDSQFSEYRRQGARGYQDLGSANQVIEIGKI